MVKTHIHRHGFEQTYLIWNNYSKEFVDPSENANMKIDVENDNMIT